MKSDAGGMPTEISGAETRTEAIYAFQYARKKSAIFCRCSTFLPTNSHGEPDLLIHKCYLAVCGPRKHFLFWFIKDVWMHS